MRCYFARPGTCRARTASRPLGPSRLGRTLLGTPRMKGPMTNRPRESGPRRTWYRPDRPRQTLPPRIKSRTPILGCPPRCRSRRRDTRSSWSRWQSGWLRRACRTAGPPGFDADQARTADKRPAPRRSVNTLPGTHDTERDPISRLLQSAVQCCREDTPSRVSKQAMCYNVPHHNSCSPRFPAAQ